MDLTILAPRFGHPETEPKQNALESSFTDLRDQIAECVQRALEIETLFNQVASERDHLAAEKAFVCRELERTCTELARAQEEIRRLKVALSKDAELMALGAA